MTTSQQSASPVLHFDLRTDDSWHPADSAGLRQAVGEQLHRLALRAIPDGAEHRFLVVDTPAGLTRRQERYEQLLGFRTGGPVRMLCLLVGGLPAVGPGSSELYASERRLVRPDSLRPPHAGLLWVGDLCAAPPGQRSAPDDPHALAVLVDLLRAPELFDQTLELLDGQVKGVAVPALRVLEQDLAPQALAQAWSEALLRFAGSHQAGLSGPAARTGEPPLLGELRSGGANRRSGTGHLEPTGPLSRAFHAGAEALADAELELDRFSRALGLLGGSARAEYEAAMARAENALDQLHEYAEQALRVDAGPDAARSGAAQLSRLAQLGLRVEPMTATKERIGEALRGYAVSLLGEGMALREAADHFARLAEQVTPLPSGRLLPTFAGLRPARSLARRHPPFAEPSPGTTTLAGLAGLLGGLWSWPVLLVGLLVPLLLAGGAQLTAARLRAKAASRRGALRLGLAGLLGALVGAAVGLTAAPPPLLGVLGLMVGAGLATGLLLWLWQHAVADWEQERFMALRAEMAGLDELLREVAADYSGVDKRQYCSDAAHRVVGVLRKAAEAAEQEAAHGGEPPAADAAGDKAAGDQTQPPDEDWGWADEEEWSPEPVEPESAPHRAVPAASGRPQQQPAPADPQWLVRDGSEGGPDLVATLAGDLADAAIAALEPYWRAMASGQTGSAAERQTDARVRELLALAREHLRRNGVLPAPPFAQAHRRRSGPTGLLGIDTRQVADAVGPFADRQDVVPLTSDEQQKLLRGDRTAIRWIHFAPAALRSAIRQAAGTDGMVDGFEVWTTSGRYAGLLSLAPLHSNAVETVRQHERGDDPEEGYETW
ncbi:hypothetical protein [Kitasatospora azatica]|uniref:hypothetical protein n=1 Tax=Kitasatospora azatica TaxID=58347 RepID=UPI00068FC11E|nr:hypothetical protein [Kitasatospora azatica]